MRTQTFAFLPIFTDGYKNPCDSPLETVTRLRVKNAWYKNRTNAKEA
jgi:hypothetical protein